jgi:hypothetical protein
MALMALAPTQALAQVYGGSGFSSLSSIGGGISGSVDIVDLIVQIIEFIFNFVLIIGVLAIVIAGMYLLTSGGDEGQKDKAKSIILYVVIGIVVILFARVIVLFVNGLFS